MKEKLPKVSFCMASLNASKMLAKSLPLIVSQDYPKDKIEILVADGGSSDDSVQVAEKNGARVLQNPLKTSEAGKAVCVKNATGEYICFVDSDNLIVEKDWLKRMIGPLVKNDKYIGSECLYFGHRDEDGFIDRYCALIGMNDPLCYWLGSYDRYSLISKKWTGLPIQYSDQGDYLEVKLDGSNIPTIGANGCIFRKSVFEENPELNGDYIFDIDILQTLVAKRGTQWFAKVKTSVVHLYCGSDILRFAGKQQRRVRDFLYRRSLSDIVSNKNTEERSYTYGYDDGKKIFFKIFGFVLSCVLFIPLLYQSLLGYSRKKDLAWFAHPLLCWITLVVYSYGTLYSFFNRSEMSRKDWKL